MAFDAVSTDGALRLSPAGDALWLTALPWKLPAPKEIEAAGEHGNARGTASLVLQDGDVTIVADPAVHSYRIR